MKNFIKILILSLFLSPVLTLGQEMEIPPPPTGLPPAPPPEVKSIILRSFLPVSTIGTTIGKQLSDTGYFIDSEILAFSGTVTQNRATGWVNFKDLGWAYLPDYSKYDYGLILFSPNMGWLEFSMRSEAGGTFYSYREDTTYYFTQDTITGDFYLYDYSVNQWNIFIL